MVAEIHGLDCQKRQIFDEGLPVQTLQNAGIYFSKVKLKKKKETLSLLIEGTIGGKDFSVSEEGRHFSRIVDELREQIFQQVEKGGET
jgi:hypothetical protein